MNTCCTMTVQYVSSQFHFSTNNQWRKVKKYKSLPEFDLLDINSVFLGYLYLMIVQRRLTIQVYFAPWPHSTQNHCLANHLFPLKGMEMPLTSSSLTKKSKQNVVCILFFKRKYHSMFYFKEALATFCTPFEWGHAAISSLVCVSWLCAGSVANPSIIETTCPHEGCSCAVAYLWCLWAGYRVSNQS